MSHGTNSARSYIQHRALFVIWNIMAWCEHRGMGGGGCLSSGILLYLSWVVTVVLWWHCMVLVPGNVLGHWLRNLLHSIGMWRNRIHHRQLSPLETSRDRESLIWSISMLIDISHPRQKNHLTSQPKWLIKNSLCSSWSHSMYLFGTKSVLFQFPHSLISY